jgi:hypothetical protein
LAVARMVRTRAADSEIEDPKGLDSRSILSLVERECRMEGRGGYTVHEWEAWKARRRRAYQTHILGRIRGQVGWNKDRWYTYH